MSRVNSGTKDQISGTSGKLEVIADRLADETMEATEWRPEAIRVVLTLKSDPKKEVSWAIPINEPDLRPFTSSGARRPEKALRKTINGMLDTEPRWANVYNNFVQRWLAPPGKHIGTLDNLRQHTKNDGTKRVWFRLITKEGLTNEFPAPWPDIECRKGDKPEGDWMGPDSELNEGKGPFPYLCALGLDWKKWTEVELEQAVALFDGHFDADLAPIDPYFQDIDDLTPELLDAVRRHGPKPVQWEVIMDDTYGLSVKRGRFFFELTPVIVEGSPEDTAYQDERAVFYEMWDNLTKVIHGDDARFATVAEEPTPEGAQVVIGLIKPVILQKPEIVKLFVDGEPKARFPIEREDWRTNGLVILDLMAERVLKDDPAALCEDNAAFLDWLAENMPELQDDLTVDEGVEF